MTDRRPHPRRHRALEVVFSLCGLVAILCYAIYRESEARLNPDLSAHTRVAPLVASTPSLERGQHLGEVVAQCTFCHGEDWSGNLISDDFLVGRLHSANLTSGKGGIATRYSDADFVRAIRHGVGPSGENLWFMPAEHFVALSDDDLASLIRFIRSLPAVDREAPARWPGPATRLAVVLGLAPELVAREPVAKPGTKRAPSPSDGERYGEYLVSVGMCGTCHRSDLRGGRHPLAPPHEPVPPDLTLEGAIATWSESDFIQTMRRGITPTGHVLSARYMPWRSYGAMSDVELGAIYRFLIRAVARPIPDVARTTKTMRPASLPTSTLCRTRPRS